MQFFCTEYLKKDAVRYKCTSCRQNVCSIDEISDGRLNYDEYFILLQSKPIIVLRLMDDYKDCLKVIFNTRLLFNSRKELAEYIGFPSLEKNGVDKIRSPFQCRAIFSELSIEYEQMTNDGSTLEEVLDSYSIASKFYKERLAKHLSGLHKEERLFDLLEYRYGNAVLPENGELAKLYNAIYNKVDDDEHVDLAVVVLLALHVLPSFQARSSDVRNLSDDARKVMDFLRRFVRHNELLENMPMLQVFLDNMEAAKAKSGIELTCYCRAYLVSCTRMVLKCYCSMTHPPVLQGVSDSLIISSKQVDIIGYWEEKWLAGTVFWQIEDAGQNTYFLYRWQFNSSEHRAIYTRYSVILVNGNTECIMIAPWYIALKVEDRLPNKPYIAIYDVEIDDEHRPTAICFKPTFRSEDFPSTLSLSRVENTENIQRLDKVVREYDVTDNFADMHYEFHPSILAITHDCVYIGSPLGMLRIPFDSNPEFANPMLTDRLGYMTIGKKTYIVYDERNIFIDATDAGRLQKERKITVESHIQVP